MREQERIDVEGEANILTCTFHSPIGDVTLFTDTSIEASIALTWAARVASSAIR